MADATYQPKVYLKQGGDELVVASGGAINVETGGAIKANGTQASAIASLTDGTTGTASDTVDDATASVKDDIASLAAKINAILVVLRDANLIAS